MNLTTRWLGLELPHPFVAGASPLADTADGARRLEDAGAAAIVLRTLFEEQLEQRRLTTVGASAGEGLADVTESFPDPADFRFDPQQYLGHLSAVQDAVSVPVVASLGGTLPGRWIDHARLCAEAGASALELNLYEVPNDPEESAGEVEARAIEVVRLLREAVSIPIGAKITPFYTAPVNFARSLQAAGADGLVLFNRLFEPDVDVEDRRLSSRLELSTTAELPLRLRWLAVLSGTVQLDLSVSGGVHDTIDAVKALMCGAHSVQMVSAVFYQGPEVFGTVRHGLVEWLEEHELTSVDDLRGIMNVANGPDERAWGRANYMRLLQNKEL